MKKKLSIFMIIFVLLSFIFNICAFASTSGYWAAGDGESYYFDYKDVPSFVDARTDYKYFIYSHGDYSYNDPKTKFTQVGFKTLPTLYYDSDLDLYYLDGYENNLSFLSANKTYGYQTHFNGGSRNNIRYIYFDHIASHKLKRFNSTSILITRIEDFNLSYPEVRYLEVNFTPIFDDSCPDYAKEMWMSLISDDVFGGYYDDVFIKVEPKIESDKLKTWKIPKEYLKEGTPTKLAYDVSDYFFTVSIENRGDEAFEFYLTANKNPYSGYRQANQKMEASASDILNTFQVEGSTLIRVESNTSWSYNFNFEEIDHETKMANAWGGNQVQPHHEIYLNFWSQQFFRVSYEGPPVIPKPPEEGGPDDPLREALAFGRTQDYLCTFTHDLSFYGNWTTKAIKPPNYNDALGDLPISDLIGGNYPGVDFNFNPSMSDFTDMIENSKGFFEFVRVVMANFVPQFMWVIIAMGLTSIVILRILGR